MACFITTTQLNKLTELQLARMQTSRSVQLQRETSAEAHQVLSVEGGVPVPLQLLLAASTRQSCWKKVPIRTYSGKMVNGVECCCCCFFCNRFCKNAAAAQFGLLAGNRGHALPRAPSRAHGIYGQLWHLWDGSDKFLLHFLCQIQDSECAIPNFQISARNRGGRAYRLQSGANYATVRVRTLSRVTPSSVSTWCCVYSFQVLVQMASNRYDVVSKH